IHHVKWIIWHGRSVPIITQNENGPCPLLAIVNLLFLRGRLTLPPGTELVTARQLMNQIGETFIQFGFNGNHRQDFEQNLFDAFSVLPKLSTGLDVNVKFSGVFDFEYTSECIVFDLLNIRLCHGLASKCFHPARCAHTTLHTCGRKNVLMRSNISCTETRCITVTSS
ncbi:conserved hypothetical protein, partial [Trichinella spiralis]|uniref:hypothetical protein n=1 Tax=Trichinella spiralis TaxID=6334 RepID=UPI0001EFD8B3